jgi:hypothetical protein
LFKNFKAFNTLQYTLNFNNKDYEFAAIRYNKLEIELNALQANKTGNIEKGLAFVGELVPKLRNPLSHN